ncbi:MAG: ribosome recycling factor [Puniceicoccales bacterium]|jgi:ribosome recycling factor|nr:ribosome recycling factor [Puniceicoccales bacterium]
METEKILKELKTSMSKAVEHTQSEFSSLHTGKASTSMIENLVADVYGSGMRIREIAAITTPDARTIQIQPWDKSSAQPIEKAILAANIGLTPVAQGMLIRCTIPEMSGERRKELVKVANAMAEEGRIAIRAIRRDSLETFKKLQKDGAISEDDLKRFEKEVQKLTDNANSEIQKLLETKEKDLLKVS